VLAVWVTWVRFPSSVVVVFYFIFILSVMAVEAVKCHLFFRSLLNILKVLSGRSWGKDQVVMINLYLAILK
jgi:hypothetical protein